MKAVGMRMAEERLAHARSAMKALEDATSYKQSKEAWVNFVIAAGALFSKLEQGAKGSNVSEAWFGQKKHLRRTDDVLKYIHHVRNAEEHGLQGSTLFHAEVKAGDARNVGMRMGKDGEPEFISRDGSPLSIRKAMVVRQVKDRSGNVVHAPKSIPGLKRDDMPSAIKVAEAALAKLEAIMTEARALPVEQ